MTTGVYGPRRSRGAFRYCVAVQSKKDVVMAIGRAIQQPIDAFTDRCTRDALVEHDWNIFGVKLNFLQGAAHEQHVVDAESG
jgi:hypothetical protein